MSKIDFWKNIIGEDWYVNHASLFDSKGMNDIIAFLMDEYNKSDVIPLQKDIFKPFMLTDYDNLKVVIMGGEIYTGSTNYIPDATGLAFGNRSENVLLHPTLKTIFNAIELCSYDGLKLDYDVTLESWAQQGVLLLNNSLTMNIHRKNSHKPMWQGFLYQLIGELNEKKKGLHFCFWGNEAQNYRNLINGLFNYAYSCPYPEVNSRIDFWACSHFQDINNNLIQEGKDQIVW